MGLFTASKETAIKELNAVNEFPLYVGEYTGNKKIVDSKIVFSASDSMNHRTCIEELVKYAKDLEYDAITEIHYNGQYGKFRAYGNMVKFG